MKLKRTAREYYDPGPETTLPVDADAWRASFDGGSTYYPPSDATDGRPKWLIAGADAEMGTAVHRMVGERIRPILKAEVDPLILVEDAPYIWAI